MLEFLLDDTSYATIGSNKTIDLGLPITPKEPEVEIAPQLGKMETVLMTLDAVNDALRDIIASNSPESRDEKLRRKQLKLQRALRKAGIV